MQETDGDVPFEKSFVELKEEVKNLNEQLLAKNMEIEAIKVLIIW